MVRLCRDDTDIKHVATAGYDLDSSVAGRELVSRQAIRLFRHCEDANAPWFSENLEICAFTWGVLAIIVMLIILIGIFWFEVPIMGNLFIVFIATVLYLMTILGIRTLHFNSW